MYIDDAGGCPHGVPPRTGTARMAFNVENENGRIRTDEPPVGIWVVGWMDFTAGPYTREGHVFFMKNLGGRYEIRDSEVAAGARSPYGSINELASWFGAYRPKYIGWSTQCDGVIYAKEETMSKASKEEIGYFYRAILGREASEKEVNNYLGQEYEAIVRDMISYTFYNGFDFARYRSHREADKKRYEEEIAKLKETQASAKTMDEGEAVKRLKALSKAMSDIIEVK